MHAAVTAIARTAKSRGMAISHEFQFVVECCRSSFRTRHDHGALIREPPLDWVIVLRLARFHRVQGLVANALSSVPNRMPDEVAADIRADAKGIAAQNLLAMSESERLLAAFSEAGTTLLFLKGLPLGALAYRNPALKSAIDIDLLVDPGDLGKAAELLQGAGYSLEAPRASSNDLHRWHRGWKESVWAKSSPRSQIDLHTRTADNSRLIPRIGAYSPRQYVWIGEELELPTLADEELFAYLAVHGSSSGWFRLKWISDFAGFLYGRSGEQLSHLFRRSQELGAARTAGQSLLLADQLFGTLRDAPALADKLRRDRATASLYLAALKLVTGEPIEPTERRFGTLPIHRMQFQLLTGMPYKLSELRRQLGRLLIK